jgi:cobalt-zinc-cadmium efflux system outer membrane protein
MHRITKSLLLAATIISPLPSQATRAKTPAPQESTPPQNPPEGPPQMVDVEEMHHHHGNIPLVKPDLPRMGRSQENSSAKLITLDDLQKMALDKNPTLVQAKAEIASAKARQLQSGLPPNPTVGYAGDEIRGGAFGSGEQGAFISQPLITGGKLGLNRKITAQDVRIAELESHEQELRVMNAVRIAYYRVLSAQEMLDSKKDLVGISGETVKTARQLKNTGQADESEVLQAEVEQQKLQMDVLLEENMLRQEWRALAAVAGNSSLEMGTLAGYLDRDLPEVDEDKAIETLLRDSPAVAIAEASVDRANAMLVRARREPIPDLQFRAGLSQDNEFLDPANHRATGVIGFAEVGVELHLFNRNQGNIQAAQSDIQRAQAETRRVELTLRERSAAVLGMYRDSRIMVDQYSKELLPRAQKSYELVVNKYGLMLASYPQVLKVQQTLFELHDGYISALEGLWVNAITLQGLLLTDGLEPPARPGEIDLPIREINLPTQSSEMPGGRQP